jgi:glyoxylase-like metal-dependent hydrolase (beta-lactamase superfamily II)
MTLLLALAIAAAPAVAPSPQQPRPTGLAKDVILVPGSLVPGAQPDGNTVVLRGPAGLVVVDTGRHPQHANAILELARSLGIPVAGIVNTHWHLDHVSNNPAIRKAYPGVGVVASDAIDGALTGFLADYRAQLVARIATEKDPAVRRRYQAEVDRIDAGRGLAPDFVVTQNLLRRVGGRPVELGLERNAVTAGDVWVFDRPTGILAAGDLVTLPAPLLDTACPRGWQVALGHLAEVPFQVLVPGHGAPMGRKEFYAWRAAFDRLVACGASRETPDACADGWVKDAGPLVPPASAAFSRSLVAHYVESALRAPPEKLARLCGEGGSVR